MNEYRFTVKVEGNYSGILSKEIKIITLNFKNNSKDEVYKIEVCRFVPIIVEKSIKKQRSFFQ